MCDACLCVHLCVCVFVPVRNYCANTSAHPRPCVSTSGTRVLLQSIRADLGKERESGRWRERKREGGSGSESEKNREEEGGRKGRSGGEERRAHQREREKEERRGLTERSKGGKEEKNYRRGGRWIKKRGESKLE